MWTLHAPALHHLFPGSPITLMCTYKNMHIRVIGDSKLHLGEGE